VEGFVGYDIGLYINGAEQTPDPYIISFTIKDSIYTVFPSVELFFPDESGYLLEVGVFTQGMPFNIKYGVTSLSKMLSVNFNVSCADVIQTLVGGGFNGRIAVKGLHNSFFSKRVAPNLALKKATVSEAVKKLFSSEDNLIVENTKGNVEAYAIDDPYRFAREVLLPQATNSKVKPYLFFRNLENELHFESIDLLENSKEIKKLFYGTLTDDSVEESDAYNMLFSFFPFTEKLDRTLTNFSANGKLLNKDLSFEKVDKSIATNADNKIPVIQSNRIYNEQYLNRQFNPAVNYDQINNGLLADAMRSSFFVNKAMCNLSFHPDLVAGRTVELLVSLEGTDQNMQVSQNYSGKWLIEQSRHTWDGSQKKGFTNLILCRSSIKPPSDSLLDKKSFSDS